MRGADTVTIGGSELRLGMSVGQAETAVPADADSAAHKELATALLLAADQDITGVKTEMRGAVLHRLIRRALIHQTTTAGGGSRRRRLALLAAWNAGL